MIVLWWMLVFSARCSGADEIPLDRAEQSSTYITFSAARAIEGDPSTQSVTNADNPAWLRVYFENSSNVEQVVIEKGYSGSSSCVYTVSVYEREIVTACGAYTGIPRGFYYNETVQCGGKAGDSVSLKMTSCTQYLVVFEIIVFRQGKY